jgi:hypothetical protein
MAGWIAGWVELGGKGVEMCAAGVFESVIVRERSRSFKAATYARMKLMAIEERSGCGVLAVGAVWLGSWGSGFWRPWPVLGDVCWGSWERVLAGKLNISGEVSRVGLSKLPDALTCRQLASITSSNVMLTLLDEEFDGQFECWGD